MGKFWNMPDGVSSPDGLTPYQREMERKWERICDKVRQGMGLLDSAIRETRDMPGFKDPALEIIDWLLDRLYEEAEKIWR